jgi:hypothetical protein
MKYLLSLLFLSFLSLSAFAQGNLQFNRVLKVSDQAQTVPAGKVWKVVSYWQGNLNVTSNTQSTCANNSRHTPFILDGEVYYLFRNVSTGSSNFLIAPSNELPMWLPAGSTLQTQCSKDFLSVIEFNIVP